MKKKIAIVFNRMIVGGAEKALINLLKAIDTTRYDVTLFTYNDKGAYFDEIPQAINIVFTKGDEVKIRGQFINDMRKFRIASIANLIFCRIMLHCSNNDYIRFMYTMRCLPVFSQEYDCVIAYKFGYEDTATAIFRIKAKKCCAWQHGTVDTNSNKQDRFINQYGKELHKIFCVSEQSRQALNYVYPQFKSKTMVIHNLVDAKEIIGKSDLATEYDVKQISIVTVGRLSSEKGQQMISETARMLVDAGYDIHWYLVGDGPLREEIEREIEKHSVSDRVILLGTQSNPYPYIKNCDIYVQPSFSEGWGLTVQEARILHKPIVTTPVPVFGEQIVSGENGLIVDAMTPKALYEGIKTLIDHPEMREKFVENLEKEDHDNSKEMQKLYDFIEGKE